MCLLWLRCERHSADVSTRLISETLSLKLIFKFNLVLTFAQFDLFLQPDSVFLLGEEVT